MEKQNKKNTEKEQVLQIVYASEPADFESAVDLLVKSFSFVENIDLRKSMNFFVYNTPGLNCLLVKKQNDVVGLQCILNRSMDFFGVKCNIGGMSYAAIDKQYQNSEVGQLLKSALFSYLEANTDISLGFARKAMDNYWYPFGYRGVTNFCEIKLPVKQVILFKTTSEARQVSKADINLLAVWYRDTYHGLLGFMERDNAIWEYHLARCNDQSLPIKIIKCKDQFIGYYFLRDNIVLEAGFNKDYKNEVFQHLVHEIKELGYMEIIFKTGKSHPLITIISRYEHSFYTRYVWKGGHIARIRSVFDFLNKIKPVLVQRIKNVNVNGFDFSCNSIRFAYTGNNLVISEYGVTDPDISFEQAEWVKLIFGVIPPTCLIRYKGDKYTSLLAILFPLCDTQFPELDHF